MDNVPSNDAWSEDAAGYAGASEDAGEYVAVEESPAASYDYAPAEIAPAETVVEETPEILGTCTLCRKQCPLSAPRCNKPYEAGLI